MSTIEEKRHSLAHLLAAAVLKLYSDTKPTLGPAIDNGFYYDFEFNSPIGDADLPKIEKKMKEILPTWEKFEGHEIKQEEAEELFKNNPYKLEMVREIAEKGEPLTVYTSGQFTDLCRGGHVKDMREIEDDSWKLSRVAGAYWRGDEKNKMLTRIYGLAFDTKEELEKYEAQQEEAKKRDHKKLGKELGLFVFSETVGKGLPLWLPKGATVRRELERFIIDEEIKRGYLHVRTPDIAKLDLYKKSGHYPHYKDSMYAPIKIDDEEFMLRPMTCPHHFELYLSSPKSFRDLPMRIAELAQQYRYEQSGELMGLQRVRTFCLADAHIICADDEQAINEIGGALDLIEYVAKTFGLEQGKDYSYRLSLGNCTNEEKYYKNDAAWNKAEKLLRELLKQRNSSFIEAEDEAAFYGPKIDIQMKNAQGKEDTAFTVQYDFCMPERFNLTYTGKDGKEHLTIVVHRSSIGAIERIMAFLIEHYAGAFPLWLSPVQIKILPVGEKQNEYAKGVYEKLKAKNIRVELDDSNETLGKKIRNFKSEKVPYAVVVGEKEVKGENITLESRNEGSLGQILIEKLIEKLEKEIASRS